MEATIVRRSITQLRLERAHKGVAKADEAFFRPLLSDWLTIIGGIPETRSVPAPLTTLQRTDLMVRLAVAMHESMGMRDAVILSVISDLTPAKLLTVGVHAAAPSTAQLVSSTLSKVFRDKTLVPDAERTRRSSNFLIEVVTRLPRAFTVQPLAVLGYLMWWMGRCDEADGASLRALSIDRSCTLASIILSATEHDIAPAWVGEKK